MSYSAADADSAWKSGIPLQHALRRYAPAPATRQSTTYSALLTHNAPGSGMQMLVDSLDQEMRPQAETAARLAGRLFDDVQDWMEAKTTAHKQLVADLVADKVFAIGYAKGESAPSRVPAYLFEHAKFVDLVASSVKGNGFEFASVRVSPTQPIAISARSSPKRGPGKIVKPLGRPSSEEAISRAVWRLIDEDANFWGKPRKVQIDLVRRNVMQFEPNKFPGGRGISDQTIKKYLAEFCRRKYS